MIAPVTPHTLHNVGQTTKLALTYTVEKRNLLATPVPAPAWRVLVPA
jgi:hypothetical protein